MKYFNFILGFITICIWIPFIRVLRDYISKTKKINENIYDYKEIKKIQKLLLIIGTISSLVTFFGLTFIAHFLISMYACI